MNILYLSQYFPPEIGATQNRAYENALGFVEAGNHVTIICEMPNHPKGVIPREYRGKWIDRSDVNGIKVVRVWVKASQHKTFLSRILFYITYMVNAIIVGIFLTRKKYDLIYASSPPLFVGGAGLFISMLRKIPLVFEVRDLWPESAIALGELRNKWAIKLALKLEISCYTRARLVITVSQGVRDRLIARGVSQNKIKIIQNGANTKLFNFDTLDRERLRSELHSQHKFITLYVGLIGLAYDFNSIIEAAGILSDDEDFSFLIIGEGPEKAMLAQTIKDRFVKNITLLDEKPYEIIPAYFSAADIVIIPIKNLDIFRTTLPVKMFDAWACERPVIITMDGEARQVMDKAQAGVFVPPENPELLSETLFELQKSPDDLQRMGINGRKYVEDHFSREVLAEKLLLELESMLKAS